MSNARRLDALCKTLQSQGMVDIRFDLDRQAAAGATPSQLYGEAADMLEAWMNGRCVPASFHDSRVSRVF